jgi:CDP-diacylglycerol--glycerol-3-phosphate 3-phosphatidyltransferase
MNLPNKLTLSRIILIPFFIAAFYAPFTCHYFVALGIFAIASITDFFDGKIARKRNLVTDLGKFLDPIADKVLVTSAIVVMVADPNANVFTSVLGNMLGLMLGGIGVVIIIARELVVSSLRMMAAKQGKVLAAEYIGKVKTFFTDVTLVVVLLASGLYEFSDTAGRITAIIALVGFGISVLLTIISGVSYLVKNKEVFAE